MVPQELSCSNKLTNIVYSIALGFAIVILIAYIFFMGDIKCTIENISNISNKNMKLYYLRPDVLENCNKLIY